MNSKCDDHNVTSQLVIRREYQFKNFRLHRVFLAFLIDIHAGVMLFVSIGPQGNDLWRGRITTPTSEHELDESPLWEKFATDCYWPGAPVRALCQKAAIAKN